MNEIDYWLDEYNLLHVNPNETSENGVLYITYFQLAYMQLNHNRSYLTAQEIMSIIVNHWNGKYFKQCPWDNRLASHDNMTAIMTLNRLLNCPPLPVRILGRYWHGRDICYYLLCKGNPTGYLFLPFLSIAMIISCLRTYKRRPDIFEKLRLLFKYGKWVPYHFEAIHTDGKLLTWLRCSTGMFPITWAICRKILQYKFGNDWLYQLFMIYFENPKHPLRGLTYNREF